jgi:hypothetical protein
VAVLWLTAAVAGEFGGDSRQACDYYAKGHTGLASLLHGNTLPIFFGNTKANLLVLQIAMRIRGERS